MRRRLQVPGPLALAALGVVFGDIGTSPLYTLTTCFISTNTPVTLANTLGIISLLAWALIVVVCIKYVTVLMRVDHEGEGGILALLALAQPPKLIGKLTTTRWLIPVVVVGAAMLIGDGMITPAISVISAVEGLNVATSAAQPYIVPISAGVLLALFLIQSRGTASVGAVFGPVMLLWFIAIGIAGAIAIVGHPAIVAAINPYWAFWYVFHHGIYGYLIFGGVILALTGAEALYADLSHFGRIPITWAWYGVVFPALLLNYFGQGANVLGNPKAIDSPFYALTGGWMLIPMVVLATLATVIASQALISGAFTLCEQAIALNLSPADARNSHLAAAAWAGLHPVRKLAARRYVFDPRVCLPQQRTSWRQCTGWPWRARCSQRRWPSSSSPPQSSNGKNAMSYRASAPSCSSTQCS